MTCHIYRYLCAGVFMLSISVVTPSSNSIYKSLQKLRKTEVHSIIDQWTSYVFSLTLLVFLYFESLSVWFVLSLRFLL